jgi:uncharacterized protein (DUF1330 family)
MPAYWLARAKINNPENYKKYTDRVPAILDKYGANVLARGGNYKIMEGPEDWTRFVVIEFATMEDAIACFESDEYKAAASFRRDGSGEVQNVIVEATEGHGNN